VTKFKELCRQCTRNGNNYACECCTESINENCIFVTNFRLATDTIKRCSTCRYENLNQKMQPCESCIRLARTTGEPFPKWRKKNAT